jgi:hypothetical protein
MGAKHTPGPWSIDRTSERHGQRPYGISAGKRGPTPKNIVNWGGVAAPTSQESEANARLIASAPDLLEAAQGADLSAVDIDADMVTISGASYRALRDAIRKATGEAP